MAEERTGKPPLTGLTVAVGIAAHRERPGADARRLRSVLDRLLADVARVVRDLHARGRLPGHPSSDEQPAVLRAVSPLCDATDREFARAALGAGYELQCPLPFARDAAGLDDANDSAEHAALVKSSARVLELDYSWTARATGDECISEANKPAYEAAGRLVVAHCDLLIAVWDGRPERGRGGTGALVREADEQRKPVLWIDPHAPHGVLLRARDERGRLRHDSLAGYDPHTPAGVEVPPGASATFESLVEILLRPPPPPPRGGHAPHAQHQHHGDAPHGKPARDLRVQYFDEPGATRRRPVSRLFSRLWPFVFERLVPGMSRHREASADLTPPPLDALASRSTVRDHLLAADDRAIHYADLYRSSVVVNYVLGAVAVTLALLAICPPYPGWALGWAFACTVLEMLVLLVILINFACAIHSGWQAKLTDYRLLSEQLRHLDFLLPLGLVPPAMRMPAYHPDQPAQHWTTWQMRNIIRAAGLTHADLNDPAYRGAALHAVLHQWVRRQRHYHRRNADRHHRLGHILHWVTGVAFTLSVIACVIHFPILFHEWRESRQTAAAAVGLHPAALEGRADELALVSGPPGDAHNADSHEPNSLWLTRLQYLLLLCAAAGPAWGGAAHGLSHHLETRRLAQRSAAMAHTLADLEDRLTRETLPAHRLGQLAQETAQTLLQEAFDWRFQYLIGELVPG